MKRNFIVDVIPVKRFLRPTQYVVEISDGFNTIRLADYNGFEVETDQPPDVPILRKFY